MANPPEKPTAPAVSVGIVIVDDHPLIREHLALVLQAEPGFQICGVAESRAEALQVIANTRPRLAIVDLSLRDSYGLDLIKDLRYAHPNVLVLVLSMQDESVYAQRSLQAGARGYITKQEATQNILEAVHRVLGGDTYLSRAMSDKLSAAMNPDERNQVPLMHLLSDRELQVFELIGRGFTSFQIGKRMNLSAKTVETYRERIKAKLKLQDPSGMLQAAIKWVNANSSAGPH